MVEVFVPAPNCFSIQSPAKFASDLTQLENSCTSLGDRGLGIGVEYFWQRCRARVQRQAVSGVESVELCVHHSCDVVATPVSAPACIVLGGVATPATLAGKKKRVEKHSILGSSLG